jgi:hypothetical protein
MRTGRWLRTSLRRTTRLLRRGLPRTITGPAQGVIVWHIGRCGSSVLGDLCDQHPQIDWDGEVYEGLSTRRACGVRPAAEALRHARAPWCGCEFKYLPVQHLPLTGLTLEALVEELCAAGFCRFVLLHRRNLLRRMVSHVIAQQTGRYRQRRPSTRPVRITLPVHELSVRSERRSLVEWFELIDAQAARLRSMLSGRPVLELSYEADVQSNPQIGYARLCALLGLEAVPVRVRLERMNPFPLADVVLNFAEVAAALTGTPYEWMLSDVIS